MHGLDAAMPLYIIDMREGFALCHVVYTIHWDETLRAGAKTEVTNAC